MRIGIARMQTTELTAKSIKETLSDAGLDSFYLKNNSQVTMADLIIVLGGDRGVRNHFHHTLDVDTPVLGVSESESSGFLSQLQLRDLPSYLNRIKKQNYVIENVPRIGVKIDGKSVYPVLNDVAIFSSKSATLMEHVLHVNGEEIWHDNSDGIIISTPIGSSAYSMSAGGPVIFQTANVFGIISVNSLDITRRPLIVSDNSIIEIDGISSRLHCDVVLDGINRFKVIDKIEVTKFIPPARIVRMNTDSTAVSALTKKVKLAEELLAMPPSSKLLLKMLEYEGSMTQKELVSKTFLPSRTVRLALKHLMENGHIKRRISMRDARQKIYEISN